MNSFRKLSIFYKILSILIIAIIAFIATLTVNVNAIVENKKILENVETTSVHLVNITSESVTLWQRIDELYTQSVSFGDEDLVENANSFLVALQENINKINKLDNTFINDDALAGAINKYKDIANNVSLGFINDEIDLEAAQQEISQKAELFESVEKKVNQQ